MKDLKIEYRDGMLIELVIDGESQDLSTMNRISLNHEAGGIVQLQMGRHHYLSPRARGGSRATAGEIVEK